MRKNLDGTLWRLSSESQTNGIRAEFANIVTVDEELLCKEMKTPPRKTIEEALSALLDEEANGGWCCRLRWSR